MTREDERAVRSKVRGAVSQYARCPNIDAVLIAIYQEAKRLSDMTDGFFVSFHNFLSSAGVERNPNTGLYDHGGRWDSPECN